jgi:DNA-binding MarR family transcriptional regulator
MNTTKTDPAYEIVWLLRRLFRALAELADGYLADDNLSAADRAVMEFLYPDEKLSVPAIAARYQVSRQHVQVTVNRLLATGLVRSEQNPQHKRSPLLRLSERGRKTFAEIRENEQKLLQQIFKNLGTSDIETTRQTLGALLKRVEEEKNHDQ